MLILSYVFDLDNRMIMLLMTDEFEEKLKKETMTLFFFGSHTHASKKKIQSLPLWQKLWLRGGSFN
jgi:hypothetical protein